MRNQRLKIKMDGTTAHVYIDEKEVFVRGFKMDYHAREVPVLVLYVNALDLTVDSEIMPTLPYPWDLWYEKKAIESDYDETSLGNKLRAEQE